MTDAELIMHEALEILEAGDDDGLTAREIFEASRLAMRLQEMTGALNRLRGQKKVFRGCDKRWRTINQAERNEAQRAERVKAAAQAVAAERAKPDPKPKPANNKSATAGGSKPDQEPLGLDRFPPRREMSPAEALDAVRRVAQRDDERRQAQHQADAALEWLIRELEEEADAAQVRLDRYVNQLGDEILEHLVEMTLAANRALEAARSRA